MPYVIYLILSIKAWIKLGNEGKIKREVLEASQKN
jgi:hypothetical protein